MARYCLFGFLTVFLLACQPEVHFASTSELSKPSVLVSSAPPIKDIKLEPPANTTKSLTGLSKKPEPPVEYRREYTLTLKAKERKAVDILADLDSSGSMDHHLGKLGGRVSSLLDFISDYDWQMGFITADHGDHKITKKANRDIISSLPDSLPEDRWQDHVKDPKASFGKLMPLELAVQLTSKSWKFQIFNQRILTPETSDYKNIFLSTVSHLPIKDCDKPPFCQRGLEQPLRSLKSAMERVTVDNGELFRPDTDFVSLIIANEEERAEDSGRATSAQDVVDTFNALLKPMGKRFFAFNILILDEECREQEEDRGGSKTLTASIGVEIAKLADLTGGKNISICAEDYGPALKKISEIIEVLVEQSVDIEEPFVPESLKVEFLNGEDIPWKLSGNRIIFEREPPKDTEIQVSYLPAE